MLKWLKNLLFDKEMSTQECGQAIRAMEVAHGKKIFELDQAASVQLIKEVGFPVRHDDERYWN